VLPYATPLNGVHASYIPQLREWMPAYVPGWIPSTRALDEGKRCKIMRAALACTLNVTFPDARTRQCYTRHASSRQSTPPPPRDSAAVAAARDDERLPRVRIINPRPPRRTLPTFSFALQRCSVAYDWTLADLCLCEATLVEATLLKTVELPSRNTPTPPSLSLCLSTPHHG